MFHETEVHSIIKRAGELAVVSQEALVLLLAGGSVSKIREYCDCSKKDLVIKILHKEYFGDDSFITGK